MLQRNRTPQKHFIFILHFRINFKQSVQFYISNTLDDASSLFSHLVYSFLTKKKEDTNILQKIQSTASLTYFWICRPLPSSEFILALSGFGDWSSDCWENGRHTCSAWASLLMDTDPLPLQSFSLVNHRHYLHDKLLKSDSLLSSFNNLSPVGFSLNISDVWPIPRQSKGGVAASLSTQYIKGVAQAKLKFYPFTSRVCVCAVYVYKKKKKHICGQSQVKFQIDLTGTESRETVMILSPLGESEALICDKLANRMKTER